jgi:C4-dicarboxylate-specific signal transduction histidine kinase
MSIKQRLALISILPLAVALLISLYVVSTNRHLKEYRQDFQSAYILTQDAFNLNFLSDRYLLFQEPQIKAQWLEAHAAIGTRLQGKRFRDKEDDQQRDKLQRIHREMGIIFALLANEMEDSGTAAIAGEPGSRKERISGALLIKARDMFTVASRLSKSIQTELAARRDRFNDTMMALFISLAFAISVISALSGRRIIAAIDRLRSGTETVANGNLDHRVEPVTDDELGRLAAAFNAMTAKLQSTDAELRNSLEALRQEVAERTQAEDGIRRLNDDLRKTIDSLHEEITERLRTAEELREKDRLLILQNRLAAMGEMIGNIAHQWRQPLTHLGLIIQAIPEVRQQGSIDEAHLAASIEKSMELILHMSQTIDDFRNFFRTEKSKFPFKARDAVATALTLIDGSFSLHNIRTDIQTTGDPVIFGYPNEYSQVLINILLNARDTLVERNVSDPQVRITIGAEGDKSVVVIADNAGGIPEEIMGKIFEPYFTTRGPDKGTGVGLYMSRTIIEKNMGGTLTACNALDGAAFRIEV